MESKFDTALKEKTCKTQIMCGEHMTRRFLSLCVCVCVVAHISVQKKKYRRISSTDSSIDSLPGYRKLAKYRFPRFR